MLVNTLQIVAKIKELPPDFADHVLIIGTPSRKGGGTAEVQSFSDPVQETPYTAHINVADCETNLNVTCTCASVKLCMHVVAFYAKFKDYKPSPDGTVTLPPKEEAKVDKGKKDEGKQELYKPRRVVYKEISRAFYTLFGAFQDLADMEDQK